MARVSVVLVLSVACAPSFPTPERDPSMRSARVLDPGCVGSAYATIQSAIDAAVDGDEIEICAGTWRERLTIVGKQLTLRSRDGAEVTILDGERLGKTLSVQGGANVVVEDLTFVNGAAAAGRGGNVHCQSSALTLRDSVLKFGSADLGGGLATRACTGVAERNRFESNRANKGGGAYLDQAGGGAFDALSNQVYGNFAFVQGGGLYFIEGAPLVDGNQFVGNRARGEGGGLRVKISEATITGNTFRANRANDRGGAVKISHDEVVMSGNTYLDNSAGIEAGGSYLFESASVISDEHYEGNTAPVGGAMSIVEGWAGVLIEDSTFTGNSGTFGGHLYVRLLGYTTTLRRVDLVDGAADFGGAVFADESDLQVENTLLQGNVATFAGGGLYLDAVTGDLTNAVAVWNDSPVGGALAVVDGAPGLAVTNTVFTGNLGGAAVDLGSGTAPTFRHDDFWANPSDFSGMGSVVGVDGNEALDPAFVDPQLGDFTLGPASPLVDAGDPSILDLDGTRSDVGLFGGPSAR